MDKIFIKNKNLVIEIPLKQDIYNPYSDEIEGEMDNIIGVIAKDEIGFSCLIDRSYKDKGPDISDIFYQYWDSKKNFRELCKKLKIDVYEYPICSKCGKILFGTYTFKNGKNICSECAEKNDNVDELDLDSSIQTLHRVSLKIKELKEEAYKNGYLDYFNQYEKNKIATIETTQETMKNMFLKIIREQKIQDPRPTMTEEDIQWNIGYNQSLDELKKEVKKMEI